jgi:isoleucyl-tRNA synthetase
LYELLTTFSKVLAPFMPFLTEMVHQRLVVAVEPDAPKSVHFCDYPQSDSSLIDVDLEARMAIAREVVVLGRKLREDHKVKTRQPLSSLTVVHRTSEVREQVAKMDALIADELNVKRVEVEADESKFTSVSVKPNFKTLGKRCGKKLGSIKKVLDSWGPEQVATLEGGATITVEEESIALEDVILQRSTTGDAAVETNGHVTAVLDTRLTDELRSEGHAREFISQVQSARKAAGLEVSDRIHLTFACDETMVTQALETHASTISAEVLASSFASGAGNQDTDVNGVKVKIALSKV